MSPTVRRFLLRDLHTSSDNVLKGWKYSRWSTSNRSAEFSKEYYIEACIASFVSTIGVADVYLNRNTMRPY